MGRYRKYIDAVKEANWISYLRKDGLPTVALRVGVDEGDTYEDGAKKLNGLHLLFQYPKNIRMLLAPQSDGRALVVHMLEAMLQKLESMLQVRAREEAAANPPKPKRLQRAHIHADTYAGNDLGPIGIGDHVTRKGQTTRYEVIGLKVSPSTGTVLVKTDEPKTRYTDVARFEHAKTAPEPVAPAADIDPGLMAVIAQTVAAYKASQQ